MKIFSEFKEFLKTYKIIGLAIAFVIAVASYNLVQSLVKDIVMPTVTPFIPGGAWKTATLALGPIIWNIGSFAGEVIAFAVIAFVVFLIAKLLIKEDKAKK